jgi:hypothetical protein
VKVLGGLGGSANSVASAILPEGAKSGPWDSSFEDYEKDWLMPKQ